MTLFDFVLRLLAAILFGFAIGLERQLTGHPAGIRINVLVCMGVSCFVLFSILMDAPDPTRIAAQIVCGVGFLCSGIIFKDGLQVRGLNTAATIWCTAAIGVLSSSGKLLFGAVATVALLGVNLLFRPLSVRIKPLECFDEEERYYRLTVQCTQERDMQVRWAVMQRLAGTRLTLLQLESTDEAQDKVEIQATLAGTGRCQNQLAEQVANLVSVEEGVSAIGWEAI